MSAPVDCSTAVEPLPECERGTAADDVAGVVVAVGDPPVPTSTVAVVEAPALAVLPDTGRPVGGLVAVAVALVAAGASLRRLAR